MGSSRIREPGNTEMEGIGAVREPGNTEMEGIGAVREPGNTEMEGIGAVREPGNTEMEKKERIMGKTAEGQEIDTVIFDIGGVLVELGRYRFLERKGFTGERADRVMYATMRSKDWVQLDLNNLSEEEILQLFIENDPEMEEDIRHMFHDVEGIVERRDSALSWLRRVKESGRRILFLSNYSPKIMRECADALYFLPEMEGGLFSCDVHKVKPDPEFYKLLIDRYNLEPSRCVFIDDLETNTDAAAALGMHTIHFETPTQAEAELDEILG